MPVAVKPAKAKIPAMKGPLDSKQIMLFEHDRELTAARFSPCGKYVFAGSYDAKIYRWELAGEKRVVLSGHHGWMQGLAFHPDGKRMFAADSWGGISAWNYADAEPKPLWTKENAHARWMRSMALSADGALLATCGADRIFRVWSAADGSPKWESPVQENDLHTVIFHPKGDLLVGDLMGNVAQWDLASHKVVRTLDAKILYSRPVQSGVKEINDVGGVRCMAFDHDGKTLACGGSQPTSSGFFQGKPTIVLIDWETGKRKQLMQWENADPAEGIAVDVSFHPDGFVMAASSGQPGKGALYCWKPGEKVPFYIDKTFAACRGVSFKQDVEGVRVAVVQVHAANGEGGNGRKLTKDGAYFGFGAQVRIFEASKL